MDYIVASGICIVALTIGILCLSENELFSRKKKYRFIVISIIIIIEIIIDTVALLLDGSTIISINAHKGLKIIEFILAPLIPAILCRLVARKAYWRKICKYYAIIIALNAIAQLMTFFVPLMFEIDENAIYTRTTYTYCYVACLVTCFMLLIISSNHTYIQNTATTNLSLWSINALLFIGMIIRGIDLHSNADWLCITLGYYIFIIYYSNSYLKIDPITLLSNRRAYNSKLSHLNFSTAIIMIDANNFKNINDTFGHQCGDLALSKIADAIFETYGKVGYCYRIGGDEFSVILKKHMLKRLTLNTENCDTYRMVYNLITALNDRISEKTDEHPMLKFGVSQGFGIYWLPSERPTIEDNKTIDEVIKIADERMYKDKLSFKQENKNIAF